jgi:excinuclease ABC subunit C
MSESEQPSTDTNTFDGKAFVRDLTHAPGVYRMYAQDGAVLYVGKAISLKKRVASYFRADIPSPRIARMVKQIARMEVTMVRNESEALILENQLIKSLRPRYNILMRDDKSYPYILLTQEQYPRLSFYRGAKRVPARYFGPYPSVLAVRETLDVMQKIFRLRSCEDTVFRNRSRPCLQYQIGRCTAPCVNIISEADYASDVRRASLFLEGRSAEVLGELTQQMEQASAALQFESAAAIRDRIALIRKVQSKQYVEGEHTDLDVLACALSEGKSCVVLLSFRNGMNLGTRAYFPKTNGAETPNEVLAAFVAQYYNEQRVPKEIILSHEIEDADMLATAFCEMSGRKVELKVQVRNERARYVAMAMNNAEMSLATELASNASQRARMENLQELLELPAIPQRMECFDISHTQGEATVASCVVFDAEGPVKMHYRRYNIADIAGGDDYAAMHQALQRRFKRGVEEGALPDVLFIDGGKGQVAQANEVLAELGVSNVVVVGVAKGEARRAGDETLLLPDGRQLHPGAQSPGLQVIQQIRDEAHRFAITGHRGRRQKARDTSKLQDIEGIGPKRRSALLKHFGGLNGLKEAGAEEISKVEGISLDLAERIYASLHGLN